MACLLKGNPVLRRTDFNKNSYTAISGLILISALLLFLPACTENIPLDVTSEISSDFIIKFTSNKTISEIQLFNEAGELILQQVVPGLETGEITLPELDVDSVKAVFTSENGETFSEMLEIASDEKPMISIRSPFEDGATDSPLYLWGEASTSVLLELTPFFQKDKNAVFELRVSAGIEFRKSAGEWSNQSVTAQVESAEVMALELKNISREQPDGWVQVIVRYEDAGEQRELAFKRETLLINQEELSGKVRVTDLISPVDSQGNLQGGLKADLLDIGSSGKNSLEQQIQTGAMQSYPVAWQKVTVRNEFPFDLPAIITSRITDDSGDQPHFFDVPPGIPGPFVKTATIIPGKGDVDVVIPIYADLNHTRAGIYQRVIEVQVAGTNLHLCSETRDLKVTRSAETALLVTGAVILMTILFTGYIIFRGGVIPFNFSTRQIVIIGLFAAASVVLVNIPAYIITSITVILLGPLSFVIDSIVSQFIYFALLVALIRIIPRQGVCAILILVRFLIGGILLGMLTPVGILHASMSAIFLELALYLSGINREGRQEKKSHWRLIFLLAIANGLIIWTGFQLSIVLFRLHYADWYIALSVLLSGFLYSLLGAVAGSRIGLQLRKTSG